MEWFPLLPPPRRSPCPGTGWERLSVPGTSEPRPSRSRWWPPPPRMWRRKESRTAGRTLWRCSRPSRERSGWSPPGRAEGRSSGLLEILWSSVSSASLSSPTHQTHSEEGWDLRSSVGDQLDGLGREVVLQGEPHTARVVVVRRLPLPLNLSLPGLEGTQVAGGGGEKQQEGEQGERELGAGGHLSCNNN